MGGVAPRSLAATPSRFADAVVEQCGAVSMTRGALALQEGQFAGMSHSAIGRMSVNGPHSPQRYS
jgi:hypothetical protein